MTTLFTRIIDGEIPGRFVWSDPTCVAFLTIAPVRPGHALVVPRTEVDHWLDADPGLMAHLVDVARVVGRAQLEAFGGVRSGLVVQGYGVPHLHLHVLPTHGPEDFHGIEGPPAPDAELDDAAERLREALAAGGHAEPVEEAQALSAR
ncbi:MAG TPA: diadenosine tetraphosphate hydrolase [Micrococcales bacterium]|uniref:HIT family protein n=1 Tax=Miniimonas arenae TaxID=676201 RepID=UPI000ED2C2F9|nr:HIT family protein [Miniimonas arenae]HCX84749.1 diadenosine tetraphosphate hydrolase [Micrococcales bacterium]